MRKNNEFAFKLCKARQKLQILLNYMKENNRAALSEENQEFLMKVATGLAWRQSLLDHSKES